MIWCTSASWICSWFNLHTASQMRLEIFMSNACMQSSQCYLLLQRGGEGQNVKICVKWHGAFGRMLVLAKRWTINSYWERVKQILLHNPKPLISYILKQIHQVVNQVHSRIGRWLISTSQGPHFFSEWSCGMGVRAVVSCYCYCNLVCLLLLLVVVADWCFHI